MTDLITYAGRVDCWITQIDTPVGVLIFVNWSN